MFKTPFIFGLSLAAIAGGSLALATQADASMSSATNGGACYAYNTGTGVTRNGYSITSTAAGGNILYCPVPRNNAASSGTVAMTLQYTRTCPQQTSYMYCIEDAMDNYGNITASSFSGYISTCQTSAILFSGIPGTAWGSLGAVCYLGTNDIIRVIDSTEY
jgi:hypothetical protein